MEIMSYKDHQQLLDYLPHIKSSLKEWLFVDVRLTEKSDPEFTITQAAELIHATFEHKEGKLYICNEREILMLLRWGANAQPAQISNEVKARLPEGSCEVNARAPTPEGIGRFELLITYQKPVGLCDIRKGRREKIVMIADDDMYIRLVAKMGIGTAAAVQEVAHGNEVVPAYKQFAPDVLFLDIHLPGVEGLALLQQVLTIDANAYVIMLSADSSLENVQTALRQGAKGFLTKPFTREKLLDYIDKCPTIAPPA